jgi:hypothetical protein
LCPFVEGLVEDETADEDLAGVDDEELGEMNLSEGKNRSKRAPACSVVAR